MNRLSMNRQVLRLGVIPPLPMMLLLPSPQPLMAKTATTPKSPQNPNPGQTRRLPRTTLPPPNPPRTNLLLMPAASPRSRRMPTLTPITPVNPPPRTLIIIIIINLLSRQAIPRNP
jgi:hypothetical protein